MSFWEDALRWIKINFQRIVRPERVLVIAGALAIGISSNIIQHFQKPPVADLPSRINTLTASLKGAADTIGQIEDEIKQREALVLRLEEQANAAAKLSALNKDQLDAVALVLRGEIKSDERQSFWTSQLLAFFYAALGVALSELYRFIVRWRARRKLAAGGARPSTRP